MTKDAIHFAFKNKDQEIDRIPLSEVTSINLINENETEGSDTFSSLRCDDFEDGLQVLRIKTVHGGHNSGRAYYLRTENKTESNDLVEKLKRNAKAAGKRARARTTFQRAQLRVRKAYDSQWSQGLIAMIIVLVS